MATKNDDSESSLDLGESNDPNVTIDLTGDDGDEQDGAEAGGDQPAERVRDEKTGKWSKAKSERGKNKREEAAWRTEKATLEGRLTEIQAQHQREMGQLRAELQRSAETRRENGQGQQANPFDAKFADLDSAISSELALIERDTNRGYERYNKLRRQETALVVQQQNWEMQQRQQPVQQQPQGGGQYAARFEIVRSEYPWVGQPGYEKLTAKVKGQREYLINVEGLPDTLDTDRQALATVVAKFGGQFGLRAPAPPSERTRQMYQGPRQGNYAPRGGEAEETEVEIPRGLAAASGLSEQKLRAALRGK